MKLLKQKGSGEIYVWDENLAKREDMEEFVKGEVQSEPVQEEQAEIEVTEVAEVEAEVPAEEVPAAPAPKKKAK